MTNGVRLRNVMDEDLPILFEQQWDPAANEMAAFTARDWDAFKAHWTKILGDEAVTARTIVFEEHVAGNILSFEWSGHREVGYWIGREFWGRGLATQALSRFLGIEKQRPLYAHTAKDNVASIRVLEKCGFTVTGHDRSFSEQRGEEIEGAILELR
jgi:RimJ/RimL family protein N-acetyltransferase